MSHEKPAVQDRFKHIIKNSLDPLMKKHGFRKKGNKYYLEGENLDYNITTYKSRYNTQDLLDFRLEWGIALKEEQKKPDIPFMCEALYGSHFDLTKNAYPQFFKINREAEEFTAEDSKVQDAVRDTIENYILPFILSFHSIQDIINILENTPDKEGRWGTPGQGIQTQRFLAILYYFIDKSEKGIEILDKAIAETKIASFREGLEDLRQQIIESRGKQS